MFFKRRITPVQPFRLKKKINWEYYNLPESSSAVQFCLDSSLHGLQYIGQQNRHCFERLFWLAAFICSVSCGCFLINQLWSAYLESPIVSEFYPFDLPLKDIAFPAITICNFNRVRLSTIKGYLKDYDENSSPNVKREALRSLSNVGYICWASPLDELIQKLYPDNNGLADELRGELKKINNFSYSNPSIELANVGQSCEQMIVGCRLEESSCEKLFRPVITDFGLCCTFNMMPLKLLLRNYSQYVDEYESKIIEKWNATDISSEDLVTPPIPRNNTKDPIFRQEFAHLNFGLDLTLEPELEDNYCPSRDSSGFLFRVHSSLEFPWMAGSSLFIKSKAEALVKIHPRITIADKSIKKFSPDTRKCYFDDEVKTILSQHTKYTEKNCIYECVSGYMLEECGCIPFFNISSRVFSKPPDVRYCSPEEHIKCYMEQAGFRRSVKGCSHCYRSCSNIQYEVDMITTSSSTSVDNGIGGNTTTLHFTFEQQMYQAQLRKEKYPVIDLISSAGGLLGLCMGFSMLSLLETLYYFTIRLCCLYRRKNSQKDSSEDNVGLASSSDQMVQNRMTQLWSKCSRSKKESKDAVNKGIRRGST